MNKKYQIEVRKGDEVLTYIHRTLRAEAFGNYNPIYCTYKGVIYQVKSEEGDLSDPFRVNEAHFQSLYIEVSRCQINH